jgi:hypothetical protein
MARVRASCAECQKLVIRECGTHTLFVRVRKGLDRIGLVKTENDIDWK